MSCKVRAGLHRRHILGLALAPAFSGAAQTQWPRGPVKLVVPNPPGSATDLVARVLSVEMQSLTGKPFLVDNKAGANGFIAANQVIHSAPDGETLLFGSVTVFAANVGLFKKLPYDPLKDFAPVTLIGNSFTVLLVRPDFPAQTLAQLVTFAQRNPGKVRAGYGSSSAQVAVAQLAAQGQFEALMVPYKGIPPATADLLAKVIDLTFVDVASAIPLVHGGLARCLGIAQEKPSSLVPEWPAIGQTFPGYEIPSWLAVAAPAGTPTDTSRQAEEAFTKALDLPNVRKKMAESGFEPMATGAGEMHAVMAREIDRWRERFRRAGIEPQ